MRDDCRQCDFARILWPFALAFAILRFSSADDRPRPIEAEATQQQEYTDRNAHEQDYYAKRVLCPQERI
jgi:hypothetical protein